MVMYIDYSKYPFAFSQQELVEVYVERPSVLVSRDTTLREKLGVIVREIIVRGELPQNACSSIEECILLYYTVLDLAKAVGDKWFQNRVALVYSKYASRNMEQESPEKLLLLGRKLGLEVLLVSGGPSVPKILVVSRSGRGLRFIPCEFAISVLSYLRVVSRRLIHDQSYSLVNNIVNNGYVYLDQKTYQRVLEEAILNTILSNIEESSPPLGLEDFAKLVAETEKLLVESRREQYVEPTERRSTQIGVRVELKSEELPVFENLFPPCIVRIISILRSGGNPSHVERFNLAAFLGSIGLDVDSVLEYFKKSADFNEKIARYQVEHILGVRGGKKKYLPYSCEKMRASGICPVQEQCKGGKNPIAVYKYNAVRHLKTSRESSSADKAAGGI